MSVHRFSRRHSRSAADAPFCTTGVLSGGLRVAGLLVVMAVVVALLKSGPSMLDAFGLVTVAAGAAVRISSWPGQSDASLSGGPA